MKNLVKSSNVSDKKYINHIHTYCIHYQFNFCKNEKYYTFLTKVVFNTLSDFAINIFQMLINGN